MGLSTVPLVTLEKVDFQRAGERVLHAINLSIRSGETLAIVGPNGSGKSTLLRALHGFPGVISGRRLGLDFSEVGMLFQRPLVFRFSSLAHVTLVAWLKLGSWSDAKVCAKQALEQFGLSASRSASALTLSGGQQQRLALACMGVRQPRLLLLDEPTANLDPSGSRELEALLLQWSHKTQFVEAGTPSAMVFSSHQMSQVQRLASRVVYLQQGRLLVDLPVEDFFNPVRLAKISPEAMLFLESL